ncbi:MAG: precorrin-6A synthase (deacetylating) [Dermatophilaceae bacterium]
MSAIGSRSPLAPVAPVAPVTPVTPAMPAMPVALRVRVLGIGMGPQHLTREVVEALASADYVIAADKGPDDALLAGRRAVAAAAGVELVAVPDPPRDRDDPADYPRAVADWHEARVDAYEAVLRERGGTAAFLVWGDPSLYDSTIRVVEALAARLGVDWDVLPGVSAPQLLAARHRVVLHPVGRPVHVTTARRLPEAVAAGQRDIVVMLGGALDLDGISGLGLGPWSIWWGANLGTDSEELAAGRVDDVLADLRAARERAARAAGWVMEICLLRSPAGGTPSDSAPSGSPRSDSPPPSSAPSDRAPADSPPPSSAPSDRAPADSPPPSSAPAGGAPSGGAA